MPPDSVVYDEQQKENAQEQADGRPGCLYPSECADHDRRQQQSCCDLIAHEENRMDRPCHTDSCRDDCVQDCIQKHPQSIFTVPFVVHTLPPRIS